MVRARLVLGRLILAAALIGGGCGQAAPAIPSASAGPATERPSAAPSAGATATATPSLAVPTASNPGSLEPSPTAPSSGVPTATPTASARPTTTPTPTVRPTPRPTATPRPTLSPPAASTLLRHGSRTSTQVALTFDMGGRVGDALAIADWLVDHDDHATIFMTGAMADNENTDAGRRVLGIIDAHPGLLSLGNHSYTHRDFRTLTAATIRDELGRTEAAIAPYCSQDPRPFFRPPNGGYDANVLAAVGAAGYRFTVTWDVDTIDWRPVANDPPGPTADQIVTKVLANAQGGSIVLMHLGGYETYEALPRIVAGLSGDGFDLVSLDQMFRT